MQRAASSCPEAVRALHTILEISLENARFPPSHRRSSSGQYEERTEDWTESKRSGTLNAPADERNSGGKGFENPGSIPSENRHQHLVSFSDRTQVEQPDESAPTGMIVPPVCCDLSDDVRTGKSVWKT